MRYALTVVLSIATLSASAFDWDRTDPLPASSSSLPAVTRPPSGGDAGRFDSYVFSLEWTPAFCEGKSGLPECMALRPGDFAARSLALHGLWPDRDADASHSYGYCGVDDSTRALDRAATWCRMPDIGASASVMSRLSAVMPGASSCLQNHEWYKHGSCSGLTPDDYFSRAAALVAFAAQTSFGRFLSASVGKTVRGDDLRAAFEGAFGAGAGTKVSLTCTKGKGGDMLLDVRLRLPPALGPAESLGAMLQPTGGAGNCPASFLIDAL